MIKEGLVRVGMDEQKVLLNEAESLAQMGSWKWTEYSNELVWSEGLYKIFNKSPGEDISWSTFLDNVFPEDMPLVENFLHEVKTNRKGSTIDYRIVKEGSIHYLSLTVKPHAILNIDILGAVVDITERKKYAQQLEQFNLNQTKIITDLDEKEKKYRSLFQRSIEPIFLTTDNLVLMDVNDSFLRFLKYSGSETSITLDSIFENSVDYNHFINTIRESHLIKDFEVSLVTKTGEKRVCLLNCVLIQDLEGGLSCYQGIIHDLSLRKRAENEMLNAERLSLTGKIARTIAHEVRNPLTNLTLALEQLREGVPPDRESAKLYLDIMERNVSRIERLIDEMLNSSKPKQLHLSLVNVKDVINETISLSIDRIKLREIQLIFTCQKNLPLILIDKDQIQIALLNIIINAVEAMVPKSGILKIDVKRVNNLLTLTISDNGKGIPSDSIAKLFDPFFSDKPSGRGLGLTSTKNILNSHHAQIEVKSELNSGTTFYIYFPLADTREGE